MDFKERIKNIDPFRPYKTKFLTLTEQAQIKNMFNDVLLEGGYPSSERKRAYFNLEPVDITCFKIIYNDSFLTLTHQNVTGSLMSLNIKREVIGDILVEHDAFFVIGEQKDFIKQEFTKVGNVSIALEEIDGFLLNRTISLLEDTIYVDSLRLDLVVSKIAKKSRNEATLMIENDFVKVNHLVKNKNTFLLKDKDVLSIRKFGRFQLLDTKKTSRKGKIILKFGKFI